jgi:hypothetical protein
MYQRPFLKALRSIMLVLVVASCASKPAVSGDQLDAAIRETSDYLNKQLPKGNKLVVLNIQSEYPALSEYIIDELIANTVNDRVFPVVDRQQLNTIREELDFQMSGEVDDDTAQALGRMAGAQIIISGAVSKIGDLYRLRVRALSVQTAQIEGQFNRNIPDSPTIVALAQSRATGYGDSGGRPAASAQPGVAPAGQSAAPALTYKIGDTGPAGGFVFYDKGNNSGGWRYLEAAPEDIDRKLYAAREYIEFKVERAVGQGKSNTRIIMAEANNRGGGFDWAVQACDSLEINGFDDWFLPSRDELHYMYGNLHLRGLGDFKNETYWSSTFINGIWEYFDSNWRTSGCLGENFSNGNQNHYGYGSQFRVRACRQF